MRRFSLILFVAFELCFYLLIIQTGIVEYFSSDMSILYLLPIGGIIGSLLSVYVQTKNSYKISAFLSLQLIVSFFYPNISQGLLFMLGISSGGIAVLMIHELKKAETYDIGIALGISYTVGTLLFNYDVAGRVYLALLFTIIVLITSQFLPLQVKKNTEKENHSLLVMMIWIFLDSTLFETLSRDIFIPIWRLDFSYEIVFFHLLGIVMALTLKMSSRHKELFIVILFSLSYFLYFLKEASLLSAIYPIVISYYNVIILQTLLQKELKTIGIYMIFTAWLASGAGLMVALGGFIGFIPVVLLLLGVLNKEYIKKMEIQNV